ncbi:MAG: hypothetical protein ACLPX9_08735 [Rhodomicrobium sp.]
MTVTARYERNHIRLSRFHIGLAAAWAIIFVAMTSQTSGLTGAGKVAIPALGAILVLFQLALAWGAMVESEIARKITVALGVLMFLWTPSIQVHWTPFFAYIALFMLPLTQWKASPAFPAVPQSSAAN